MDVVLKVQESIDSQLISKITRELTNTTGWQFKQSTSIGELDYAFIPERKQFDSLKILKKLLSYAGSEKILGIVDIDLCTTILSFVFGQAQLGGKVAVISIHRLKNEYYQLPPSEDLLISRAKKEIIHEIGHLQGLYHCNNRGCVMNFSGSIIKVDMKNDIFCASCSTYLDERKKND